MAYLDKILLLKTSSYHNYNLLLFFFLKITKFESLGYALVIISLSKNRDVYTFPFFVFNYEPSRE